MTPHLRRVALWLAGLSAVAAFYDPSALWAPLLQIRFALAIVASGSLALALVGPDRGASPGRWTASALAVAATMAAVTPCFWLTRAGLEGILASHIGTSRQDLHHWWYPRAHPADPENYAAHDYYGGGPEYLFIPKSPLGGGQFQVHVLYDSSDTGVTVTGYEVAELR